MVEPKSPRDAELIKKGWMRRFSAGRPRLDEAVQTYGELGLDVLLEPVDTGAAAGGCTACMEKDPDAVKVIYTRPPDYLLD